jgi:uncharacterized membrane protein
MLQYPLFFIPSLFWGLNTVIEKYHLLNVFSAIELVLLRGFYFFFFLVIYIFINKKFINKVKNMGGLTFFYLTFATLLSIAAVTVFWMLLKKYKTIYPTAITSSFWVVFSVLFGYLLYNEKITQMQILGIIFITIGLFLINK